MSLHLHQLLAVSSSRRKDAESVKTHSYKRLQVSGIFDGHTRRYQPRGETGEPLPAEDKPVIAQVVDILTEFRAGFVPLVDTVSSIDRANTSAAANVVIDGVIVMTAVPVTTLLFLEKQATDLMTFLDKIPTVDLAEKWAMATNGLLKSEPRLTTRTKKTETVMLLAPATKEHPAQVKTVTEDVIVGDWETIKFSGAMKTQDKADMLARARKVLEAVQIARELANSLVVAEEKTSIGAVMFDFVISGTK